jgi:ATP-binding cassette subfamily B protein RaxB
MVAGYFGASWRVSDLCDLFPPNPAGVSARSIVSIASAVKLAGGAYSIEVDDLPEENMPIIVHWKRNHFVVLIKITENSRGRKYHIADPAVGAAVLSYADFSESYSGIAFLLRPRDDFVKHDRKKGFGLIDVARISSIGGMDFAKLLIIFAVIEALILCPPMLLGYLIDRSDLFQTLSGILTVIIFISILIFSSTMVDLFRASMLRKTRISINQNFGAEVIRKLHYISINWFERRHFGDIISRFGSIRPIIDFSSQKSMSMVLDSIIYLICIILIFCMNSTAFISVIFFTSISCIIHAYFLPELRHLKTETLHAAATAQGLASESMFGIRSIKAFGAENVRFLAWQSFKTKEVESDVVYQSRRATAEALDRAVITADFFCFAALIFLLPDEGTSGLSAALPAFLYRGIARAALLRIQSSWIDFRDLDHHLARVSDILGAETDWFQNADITTAEDGLRSTVDKRPPAVLLEFENVAFSYSGVARPLLENVSFSLRRGETIGLQGPSGAGKTSLIDLVLGMKTPSKGRILRDGQMMSPDELRIWRRRTGYVAQSDMLFSGSIAQNISFFDADFDEERVVMAAKTALVHEEIDALPMSYLTQVGEMSNILSGGQKSRVLLARALYRRPDLLLLDEITANLDPELERAVINSIHSLGCSIIAAAHRPAALQHMDTIYTVSEGRVEISSQFRSR